MISNITNVNCLVELLKQFNIKHIVMAPGASDIPVIHIIETDDFFECYSVVDERSLVYFAMGISQQLDIPVACVCTSGTAVSNFLPGMTEAFYRDVPIIAITCDKNQNFQGQLEIQKIEQVGIFGESCRKCVNLPVVTNDEERWLCERLINEALIAMTHHGRGPVQINIPVIGDIGIYSDGELSKCQKIDLIENTNSNVFNEYIKTKLPSYHKIMVVIGQDINFSSEEIDFFENFAKTHNAIFAVDHQSNLNCYGVINTYVATELEKELDEGLLPSLVISIGNNISSYDLKYILRSARNIDHWQIDESGRIRDVFHHLSAVFECSSIDFFRAASSEKIINNEYLNKWKEELNKIKIDDIPYSSFFIAKELSKAIPQNSILHLGILNSTRLMQYFELAKSVKTYSNLGALGIDGCLSSFMGQAVSTDELAFCLLGDLSFFYDMNAAGICHKKNNIRIVLLNNSGAGEFYFTLGKQKIDTIDKHIAAVNGRVAKGWIESLGYEYHAVSNATEAHDIISKLNQPTNRPVFVEVFLNIEEDTGITRDYYAEYRKVSGTDSLKGKIKGILGDNQYNALKNAYHRIKI
ncbi:MAG: thiamine pyrophosphate-binding protein [Lachnospiraceae bacterium]|nr:thiamine pyrophosphate-binding protein [Lachnospiraceae bacterium]